MSNKNPKRPLGAHPKTNKFKGGAFSNEEKQFLLDNAEKTYVELAQILKRRPHVIQKWMQENGASFRKKAKDDLDANNYKEGVRNRAAIARDFEKSSMYRRLRLQFSYDELQSFKEQWISLVDQFKEDVMATEENQIAKLITYQLLMDRNLIERRRIMEELEVNREAKESLISPFGISGAWPEEVKVKVQILEQVMGNLRESDRSMTREYKDLEDQHQKIMRDLKGTRKERIDKIESGKVNFIALLKELEDEEKRMKEDRNITLMSRASDQELIRLSQPHRYMNNEEDLPVLSAETLEIMDAVEKEKQREKDTLEKLENQINEGESNVCKPAIG